MAVISKKTALVWVLIVAGAVTLWKFVWKPEESEESAMTSQVPARNAESAQGGTQGMVQQAPSGMMETGVKKSVAVRTSYGNPAGSDEVGFVLALDDNGVIVNATTEVLATHDISKARQAAFASGLGTAIQGKKLSELTAIDRVGGSSLTTNAFNKALPELKAQL